MYHFEVKIFSRYRVKSIVAPAAYRSAEKLYDERNKRFHDFTHKKGVVHTEIMIPSNAPSQFADRATLWNTVEKTENRKDSRLARQIIFALPRELNLTEQIELATTFVGHNCVCRGMIADLCIHEEGHYSGNKNPHAHVLLTDRPVNSEGFLAKKDPSWNNRQVIMDWRKAWAELLNMEYERRGLEKRVSHESYRKRGITDRKPTKHLGPRVLEYAENGQMTDRFLDHLKNLHSDQERERLMVRSLENLKNTRERKRLMAHFMEIAGNELARERLAVRFLEILDRCREQEKQRERPFERSR